MEKDYWSGLAAGILRRAADDELFTAMFGPPPPPRRPKFGHLKDWAKYRRDQARWKIRHDDWAATHQPTIPKGRGNTIEWPRLTRD